MLTLFQVEVLRINDFIAVIVQERRDYKNNNVGAASASTLSTSTRLYVGGIPPTLTGLPFTGTPVCSHYTLLCYNTFIILSY